MYRPKNLIAVMAAAAVLSGCALAPRDNGRAAVDALLVARGLDLPAAEDTQVLTQQLLGAPLTADSAVQLALLNSPALRVEFAQLGFSAAQWQEAGRLANPVLSAVHLSPGSAAATGAGLTLGIAFDVTDLLLLPARKRFSAAQFEATRLAVGDAVLHFVGQVQQAWYEAVRDQQVASLRENAARSLAASAALAKRYFDAGNINRRVLAMEEAAAGLAQVTALAARSRADASRSQLNQLMGFSPAENTWVLAGNLSYPDDDVAPLDDVLRHAARQRLDIAAAGKRAQAIAGHYRLTRQTRLLGGMTLGVEREKDYDGAVHQGPSVALALPLFNWGGGRARAAKAALTLAEAELDRTALAVGNEVQRAWQMVQSAKKRIALYRDVVVPKHEAVTAYRQEEMNFMLTGVFEVIAGKQQTYEAYAGYLEALGEYWHARVALVLAVGGALPPAMPTASHEKTP